MMVAGALVADITPTTVAAYEDRRGREETSVLTESRSPVASAETLFVSYWDLVPLVRREGLVTLTIEDQQKSGAREHGAAVVLDREDAVARARDARIALLARRYEGESSVEDDARIEILTLRLRRLSPRVTKTDLEGVEQMVEDLEGVAANLDAIRSKFGLR
jgi:hypothetical protein